MGIVVVETAYRTEPVAQRSADHGEPGGCTYKGEWTNPEVHVSCGQTLADHPRQEEILHSRVKDFFDHPVQTVYLINEEHVTGL